MKRRLAALSLIPLFLLVTGCSQIEDAASNAVNDAASAASDAVNDAAAEIATASAEEVERRVCALIEDGAVSAEEMQILSTLVSSAESVGLPADIISPLKDLAAAGDDLPADSLNALGQECAA